MRRHFLLLPAVLLLSSCGGGSQPKAEKAPKAPPEAISARSAFQQVFISARTWAQDLQILRVRNLPMEPGKAEPGKAFIWEVTLVSPSKGKLRPYTYSAIEQGNIHEGVFGGPEEVWTGKQGQNTAFLVQAFKVDSTSAFETAAEKSKEYMQKNPDMPITFLLEKTPRYPDPAWRVIWGTSAATSGHSIYVDATTGAFLERMR